MFERFLIVHHGFGSQHLLWIWQGPPCRSALRKLAEKFLKRQIQKGTHDSVDDARAAMDLVLLKIRCAFS